MKLVFSDLGTPNVAGEAHAQYRLIRRCRLVSRNSRETMEFSLVKDADEIGETVFQIGIPRVTVTGEYGGFGDRR